MLEHMRPRIEARAARLGRVTRGGPLREVCLLAGTPIHGSPAM